MAERFESDAAWGGARSTTGGGSSTAPSVSNLGISWTPNDAGSGVTTGNNPARTGSWGFFELYHGNYNGPLNPITNDFVTAATAPAFGFGGWFTAHGASAKVRFVFDGTGLTGVGRAEVRINPKVRGFELLSILDQPNPSLSLLLGADRVQDGCLSGGAYVCSNRSSSKLRYQG